MRDMPGTVFDRMRGSGTWAVGAPAPLRILKDLILHEALDRSTRICAAQLRPVETAQLPAAQGLRSWPRQRCDGMKKNRAPCGCAGSAGPDDLVFSAGK